MHSENLTDYPYPSARRVVMGHGGCGDKPTLSDSSRDGDALAGGNAVDAA